MSKQRRTFSAEFKRDAAALVLDQGYSHLEASRSLGVVESVLRRWVRQLSQERHGVTAHKKTDENERKRRKTSTTHKSQRNKTEPCLMCRDPVTTLIDDDVITSMSIACACAAVCTRSLNKVVKRLAAARSGTCCKKAALR